MVAIYQPGETIHIGRRPRGVGLSGGGGALPWYQDGSDLANSLVAYWELDEASGARADTVGANTLTDNNTVGSAAGLVYPLAADFVAANSESLSIADNAALSTGDIDWWTAAWFFYDEGVSPTIISRYGSGVGEREFWIGRIGGNINLTAYNSAGSSIGSVSAPFTVSAWQLVIAYHSATSNLVGISTNGAAFVTSATSGAPSDTAAPLQIGAFATPPSAFWDGRISPAMMGKGYIPANADATYLYNGGLGRA